MPDVPERVRELLGEHPWEDTIPRLLRHASNKTRRHTWMGVVGGRMPAGKEITDLVQAVIQKVLSGKRSWDPVQHPDLALYLRDAVDSEISNLVRGRSNTKVVPGERLPEASGEDDHEGNADPFDRRALNRPSPEEVLLESEDLQRAEDYALGFLDFLSGERDLYAVAEAILDDYQKPAAIAQHLGVDAEEVYRRRKRLARRLIDYEAQTRNGGHSGKGGD